MVWIYKWADRPWQRANQGKLSGTMKIVGDITQPIEDPEAWEALR